MQTSLAIAARALRVQPASKPAPRIALVPALRAELLIDSAEFWSRLREDIAGARRRVLVEAMSFEGDAAGQGLVDALERARAADRRVLVDSFTRYMINDRFLLTPRAWRDGALMAEWRATSALFRRLGRAGVGLRFTNPVGPLFLRFPARNHKKLVVIDDEVAYLGGINFSDHNYAWHDLMLRIEHPDAARLLTTDFDETWNGRHGRRHGSFEGLDLHLLDGCDNHAGFAPVLRLIDGARRSVFLESPYVTFPFLDRLIAARRRGVEVVVVTPEHNNWGPYRRYLAGAVGTGDLRLLSYSGRMTHLKGLLVDDHALVLGSSNFDYFSYAVHHEVLAVVTDPAVIGAFRRRVIEPDLAASRPVTARGSRWQVPCFKLQLKILVTAIEAIGPGPVAVAPGWMADEGARRG